MLGRYQRERLPQRDGAALSPTIPSGTGLESVADQRRRPDELAELHDGVRRARGELAALKRDERRALGLLALGYSYREICEITGWTYTDSQGEFHTGYRFTQTTRTITYRFRVVIPDQAGYPWVGGNSEPVKVRVRN